MVVIAGLIALIIIAVLNAAPIAFLGTLFLGNLGFSHLGFLDLLPGAMVFMIAKNNLFNINLSNLNQKETK